MCCQFLPPYLVQRLVTDGDEDSPGSVTLRLDDRLRTLRETPARSWQRGSGKGTSSRVVHDADGTEELPGRPVRHLGEPPTGDPAVDEAYDSSGQVWDLFAEEFHRRSVDGNGTALSVTVHYGQGYDNAFWDGRQLVFGDGDGKVFKRFTKPMDVLAHEFTHGVTQFTAALNYQGQPGALNESVSDVFAAMTRQRALGQSAAEADWLIGSDIFRPGVRARALRSMLEPGTAYDDPRLGRDPQVGSWADYVDTEEDSGGVHINSGIPNRAFALTAQALGARSWQQAGQVWYDTLTSGAVGADADFATFARATLGSARQLYPDEARVADAVQSAWKAVGVSTAETAPRPAAPSAPPTRQVAVSRSGGFTGITRSATLDLDADPEGEEVRGLLTGIDLQALNPSSPAPDRFVYTLEYGEQRVILPEQDLTPELHRVVQIVLQRLSPPTLS